MISKWFDKKEEAVALRKKGLSIRTIEKKLGIPRSTLSGWLRSIEITPRQKEKLKQDWLIALIKARVEAAKWHNEQKKLRFHEAEGKAKDVLSKIDVEDPAVLDLALAMLYLGEGFKKSVETGIGNSDPLILKFFLTILSKIYSFDMRNVRCELHLRADQDAVAMKRYWAKQLGLPMSNFKYVVKDKRTVGTQTYSDYKGVCLLRCANVAIQRKLVYLSRRFCEKVVGSAMRV